jgi:predicted membrane channel-forming protein YqfA (hemolysin III family)
LETETGVQMTIPKKSSWLVFFFGFMVMGLAAFDSIRHIHDAITSTFLFLGLLAFAVGSCLRNIETRLASVEQSLQLLHKG